MAISSLVPRLGPLTLAALLLTAWVAPAVHADDWKLDVVHLKNGNTLEGLVLEDKPDEVRMRTVTHPVGRPVTVKSLTLKRAEVASLELLNDADHGALVARLDALAKERQTWAALLSAIDPAHTKDRTLLDKIDLARAPWGKEKDRAWCYQSTHFRIVSNARQDLVYLTAIQLEQIHEAYIRMLPPRVKSPPVTTVLLPQSGADYQTLLKEHGQGLLSTAYFDAARNEIVCPSELQRLSDEWARAFQSHQQLLDRLKEQEADLNKLYRWKVPADLLKRLQADRERITAANEQNRKDCETILPRLFQPLYHEAFHAYLANCVYPAADGEVPRWLNEGLAQIFETATLEAGELRVERPDKDRLLRAQALSRKVELVPLTDLLKAGPRQFLVAAHNTDLQTSDRHYLTSWALAYYLTFDRKLLGPRLDQYVASLHRGTDPVEAFRDLVGQPLGDFDRDFHQYLLQLRPDGSLGKSK